MNIRLSPSAWGAIAGLSYGMITMFPEWLFYMPNNSAISVGMIFNFPATLLLVSLINGQTFSDTPIAGHYFVLIFVLLVDMAIGAAGFYLIHSIFRSLQSRRSS